MTYGDLIRQMTDLEMGEYLKSDPWCRGRCWEVHMDCQECVKHFITSEVEDKDLEE